MFAALMMGYFGLLQSRLGTFATLVLLVSGSTVFADGPSPIPSPSQSSGVQSSSKYVQAVVTFNRLSESIGPTKGKMLLGYSDETLYDNLQPGAQNRVLSTYAEDMESYARDESLIALRDKSKTTRFMTIGNGTVEDAALDFQKMSPKMHQEVLEASLKFGTLTSDEVAAMRMGAKTFRVLRVAGKASGWIGAALIVWDVGKTGLEAKKEGMTYLQATGVASCKAIDDLTYNIYCTDVKEVINAPQTVRGAMVNMSQQKDFDGSLLWDMATREQREKAQRARDATVQSCIETYQYDKKTYPTLEDVQRACEYYRSNDADPSARAPAESPASSGAAH